MAISAPWFGWSLAHVTHDGNQTSYAASNILTGLAANEKLVVLGRNLLLLLASPFSLLTGLTNSISVIGTVVILIWCFYVRRQLVPDLFVVLYGLALLCWISPPERLLWTSLRAVRTARASCALSDLQCTGGNQPSRINCAMPRASLRSDFTGIASNAFRTCRVSSSSTANPASRVARIKPPRDGRLPARSGSVHSPATSASRSALPVRWLPCLRE